MIEDEDEEILEYGEGHKIDPECIDELRDTFIEIGCYRETSRLDRMLRVFKKAMHLARKEGDDELLSKGIRCLHDRKGVLTVVWVNVAHFEEMHHYVETAWADECEVLCVHVAPGMRDEEGRDFIERYRARKSG